MLGSGTPEAGQCTEMVVSATVSMLFPTDVDTEWPSDRTVSGLNGLDISGADTSEKDESGKGKKQF